MTTTTRRVSDAARAVDRFQPGGPTGYRAKSGGPIRATRAEAEADQAAADLAPECRERGEYVAAYAARFGIVANVAPVPTAVAYRLAWDAHAASDYAKPVLADAADVAALWPHLAPDVWHHAAGATILGRLCCGTPASHRDALVHMARKRLPL